MTKPQIKKYHKQLGYFVLILSIVSFMLSKEGTIIEGLIGAVVINLGYHMCYYFFAGMYSSMERMRSHNAFNKVGGRMMMGLFAVIGVLIAVYFICHMVINAFLNGEYGQLFGLCIPFGVLLGAMSLWTDIREESKG